MCNGAAIFCKTFPVVAASNYKTPQGIKEKHL